MSCLVTRRAKNSAAYAWQRRHLHSCQKERRRPGIGKPTRAKHQGKVGSKSPSPHSHMLAKSQAWRNYPALQVGTPSVHPLLRCKVCWGSNNYSLSEEFWLLQKKTPNARHFYNLPGLLCAHIQTCVFEKVVDLSITKSSTWWFQSRGGADWPRTKVKHRKEKSEPERRAGSFAPLGLSRSVGVRWILVSFWWLTTEQWQWNLHNNLLGQDALSQRPHRGHTEMSGIWNTHRKTRALGEGE